jgi:thiamine kinase-like enzyme
MNLENIKKIKSIPIWKSELKIEKINGGITNQNFLVEDSGNKFVVRLGEDIPEHLVSRANELMASKAASICGISPDVIYSEKGVLILKYIDSTTLTEKEIKKNIIKIIPIIKKTHYEMPKKIFGQSIIFWVFHVIRNYKKFLENNNSPYKKLLNSLVKKSEILEVNSSPFEIVFCHNDLLAANFLNDGSKLWIIDWEYAGYNSPLFDLGGLASNNDFNFKEEIYLIENYFEKKINDKLLLQYNSMKCASLLREAMWSMVSEINSNIDFDYRKYTKENIYKFNESFKNIQLK